ncbi:two-component response regulator 24-like [Lycium barbarum]|uniref:two-component response regulator 24-like n=1 Tax=Lycium ferocissimum TaxID=112874 RepID=UPI0028167795|nr:two-component response regulator 24-like [Lycium ferocissimum]XP_060194466.1 two-component response regulator 24-like [Lycium barbarum]
MSSSNDASSSLNNSNANSSVEKKLKALMVYDNRTITMIHEALLRRFGVETHEAKDGQEVVLAHRSGACFDLILMDLDMRVVNARQTIKELRDMHVRSVIAGLTFRGEEEMKPFMDAGLDYYYPKPLPFDVVRHLVEKIKEDA